MNTTSRHPLSKILAQRPQGPMRSPARVLGWFSIGLGLAELLMPRILARATGVPAGPLLMRACGLREIGVGIGLLTSRDPSPWLWGRVGGDVLDIATTATGVLGARPARAAVTTAVLGGVMALDLKCATLASKGPRVAVRDYSLRSGFPKPAEQMRGVAKAPWPQQPASQPPPSAIDADGAGRGSSAMR